MDILLNQVAGLAQNWIILCSENKKGNFVELHWRDQEEGRYGPVVTSLKFIAEQELRSWSCWDSGSLH